MREVKTKKLKQRAPSRRESDSARPHKARPEFWLWAFGLVVGIFAAFQVYAPALRGPFLFDDSYLPMNVPAWANGSLLDWMRGVRPLLMASYWVNYHLAGMDTSH